MHPEANCMNPNDIDKNAAEFVRDKTGAIIANMEKVMVGKREEIKLVLTSLLSSGHVLLEDVPGTGKTMLAKSLAKSFDCGFKRIQFTPDLLPSDLTGINIYSPKTGDFTFRPGSLFTNFLLADEINRATPRTQSGLLESMEEKQITVDGRTYILDEPYFVIATQNPIETQGTFPLPEAQLDRFLMQLSVGYPDSDGGAAVIDRFINDNPVTDLGPVCGGADLLEMRKAVSTVTLHTELMKYIVSLAEATRAHEAVALGVSPRGSLSLARAAQSYAAISGRSFTLPDDIKYVAPYACAHRLILRGANQNARKKKVIEDVLASVPVPTEEMWK